MIIKTVGERLNYCRSLLGKSRQEVSKEIGTVSLPTLSRWELDTTAIPVKKIDILIKYFAENNIFVSKEWLINGTGHSPIDGNLQEFNKNNFDDIAMSTLFSIKREIKNFWFSQVSNNFFSPFASFGDYVGGIQCIDKNFLLLKGKICFFCKDKEVFIGTLGIDNDIFAQNVNNQKLIIDSDYLVGEMQWLVKRP